MAQWSRATSSARGPIGIELDTGRKMPANQTRTPAYTDRLNHHTYTHARALAHRDQPIIKRLARVCVCVCQYACCPLPRGGVYELVCASVRVCKLVGVWARARDRTSARQRLAIGARRDATRCPSSSSSTSAQRGSATSASRACPDPRPV